MVRAVVSGRRGAVRELVDGYGNLVRRVVHRLVDDPRDREEIWQDTFVQVVRALPRFRGESRLSTWIGRIAYRECVGYLRRRSVRIGELAVAPEGFAPEGLSPEPRAPEPLVPTTPPPEDRVIRRELERFVRDAVELLTPAQKAAVTLYYLEEMTVAEVAEVMDAPENTVKSHLHRARERLRTALYEEARERGYAD